MKDVSKKVYFARCIGPDGRDIGAYKIGCSHGHELRVKYIASCLPFSLEVEATSPGDFLLESMCHLKFRDDCLGGEYFRSTDAVVSAVRRAAETGEVFPRLKDGAYMGQFQGNGWDILDGFLRYHELAIKDACESGGMSAPYYEKALQAGTRISRKMVAAAALAALDKGHFVSWPSNAYEGCLGETYTAQRTRTKEATQ